MRNYRIWKLIQQYVTGNCSPQSHRRLEQWMDRDPANRKLVEEVARIWELTPEEEFDVDVQQAWERFYLRHIKPGLSRPDSPEGMHKKARKQEYEEEKKLLQPPRTVANLLRVAAVLLLASFAGFFTHVYMMQDGAAEEMTSGFNVMQELVTGNKEKAQVTFSDGTEVTLNAAGSLTFPKEFDGANREIYLDGEAYFKVVPQGDHPLIVHTNDATVKVLGTEFNVQAWSEDGKADVVVREGRVAVSSAHNFEDAEEVILTGGQYTRVQAGENPVPAQKVDADKYLLWTGGGLYFDNTPLRTVLRQIERRYGVEIAVSPGELLDIPFTSTFYEAELDEVLKVIAASMELNYQREGQRVEFREADIR